MVVSFLASKCLLQCDQLDESRGVTSTILKQMKERVSASVSDFTCNFRRLRPKTFVITKEPRQFINPLVAVREKMIRSL